MIYMNPVDRAIRAMTVGAVCVSLLLLVVFELL